MANWANGLPPMRVILNRAMKLAPQRSIPTFAPSLHRWFARRRPPSPGVPGEGERPVVILYADCFVTYNEPHIGIAAIEVLEALGYEVRLPSVGCCGRAMISTGL